MKTPQNIRVILVDDEPEACENLHNILRQFVNEDLEILGYAHDTKEAETKIKKHRPDAIFLDIEMPNENAFQFLERLEKIDFEIIFVTAYDDYAIRAFKLNAIDYILKPINIEELSQAVIKLKEKFLIKQLLGDKLKSDFIEISEQINQKKKQQHIILSDANTWESVSFSNISYVKAMGSYSKIYYQNEKGEQSIILSRAISEYENMLPQDLFFRVHRSFLINCNYVQKIMKGEIKSMVLHDGTEVPIGRRRYTDFVQFMKNKDVKNV